MAITTIWHAARPEFRPPLPLPVEPTAWDEAPLAELAGVVAGRPPGWDAPRANAAPRGRRRKPGLKAGPALREG
jgi:hypothetical protein